MDISSAESGRDAGETKASDMAQATEAALDTSSSSVDTSAKGPEDSKDADHAGAPKEAARVEPVSILMYGPAQHDVEIPDVKADPHMESPKAPEIKADKNPEKATSADIAAKMSGSALIPFVAKPKDKTSGHERKETRPPRFEMLRSRGMQAALLAACLGIGWAVAGSSLSDHGSEAVPAKLAALSSGADIHHQIPAATDPNEIHRLSDDIRVLKKEIDSLKSSMAQNPAPEELRTLKKSVDALKNGLDGTKSEMASSIAQLSAKLDKAQHDPAKLREISDRLDHMEHAIPLTTASIAPQEPPKPSAPAPVMSAKVQPQTAMVPPQASATKPQPQASTNNAAAAPASPDKPQLITNWVVRDVYDGIALVEGPHGSIEVIEGETIPGAGTVKSIEKRGTGWIVVTNKGLVDSARN